MVIRVENVLSKVRSGADLEGKGGDGRIEVNIREIFRDVFDVEVWRMFDSRYGPRWRVFRCYLAYNNRLRKQNSWFGCNTG